MKAKCKDKMGNINGMKRSVTAEGEQQTDAGVSTTEPDQFAQKN